METFWMAPLFLPADYFNIVPFHPQNSTDACKTLRQDEDVALCQEGMLREGGRITITAWLMCWALCREVWKWQPFPEKLILFKQTISGQGMRNMIQESERQDRCAMLIVELLFFGKVLTYTQIGPFIYRLEFLSLFTVQFLNYIKNKSFIFVKSNSHAG